MDQEDLSENHLIFQRSRHVVREVFLSLSFSLSQGEQIRPRIACTVLYLAAKCVRIANACGPTRRVAAAAR